MRSNGDLLDDPKTQIAGHKGNESLPFDSTLLLESKKELERVLHHPTISRSLNLVRFLSFICNKHFDGEGKEIRERMVAVEALGRKESTFDSHADPIVRVTARDLRKKLREYYENEGRDYPIQIVLPKGRYIPQFVRNQTELTSVLPIVEPATEDEEALSVLYAEPPESFASYSTLDKPSGRWQMILRYALGAGLLIVTFLAGYLVGHRQRP